MSIPLVSKGIRRSKPSKNQVQKQLVHLSYRGKAGGKLAESGRLSKKISPNSIFFDPRLDFLAFRVLNKEMTMIKMS
ncbi:MAG: hypothetical protein KJO21_02450 [Verrucomicrobiae bacterium]|nr:hypothetical protein [Verrucomicrobiae bacterium]NNJ44161.1 hypothetical protein [Akkermansiaceae bacterium]